MQNEKNHVDHSHDPETEELMSIPTKELFKNALGQAAKHGYETFVFHVFDNLEIALAVTRKKFIRMWFEDSVPTISSDEKV